MASTLLRSIPLAAALLCASAAPAAADHIAGHTTQDPCKDEGGNNTTLCAEISATEASTTQCPTGGSVVTIGTKSFVVCNGATGATGGDGAKGDTGDTGATGATGQTGAAGQTGATGASGATGTAGQAGADGATGAAGPVSVSAASLNVGPQGTCVSRRTFTVRIKERSRLASVSILANGKTVRATRKNGRLTAVADFRRVVATRGQIVPVRIVGRTTSGKRVVGVRLYRLCTPGDGVELNIANNL